MKNVDLSIEGDILTIRVDWTLIWAIEFPKNHRPPNRPEPYSLFQRLAILSTTPDGNFERWRPCAARWYSGRN